VVPATIIVKRIAGEVMHPLILKQKGIDPDAVIDWDIDVTRTVIVAVIVWRPDPRLGLQVDLQNIEDTIFELREHYPSLGHSTKRLHGEKARKPSFTFDHWNSAFTIQRMRTKHMNVEDEQWSNPFQVDIYRNARSQFYNSLVSLPDTPSITSKDPMHPGAIYELERLEFIDGSKVDHPEGGSKDTADAVVRVIQHATEHNQASLGFATVYGNRSSYKQHAQVIPNPSPTIDPSATPGISQAMRDAEAERLPSLPSSCETVSVVGLLSPRARTDVMWCRSSHQGWMLGRSWMPPVEERGEP
jgi:hypothetical protein